MDVGGNENGHDHFFHLPVECHRHTDCFVHSSTWFQWRMQWTHCIDSVMFFDSSDLCHSFHLCYFFCQCNPNPSDAGRHSPSPFDGRGGGDRWLLVNRISLIKPFELGVRTKKMTTLPLQRLVCFICLVASRLLRKGKKTTRPGLSHRTRPVTPFLIDFSQLNNLWDILETFTTNLIKH